MPRSLVVYFSQGGTTGKVAEAIASGLRFAGYDVDMCNIKDGQPPDIGGYSLLGIGLPVYWYRPPFNVMDYLHSLPEFNGLPAFVFVLYGTYRGDTSTTVRRLLARKGAKEVGYFHCQGVDYFLGYLKVGYLFSPGHPIEGELAQAKQFGQAIAAHVDGKEYAKPDEDLRPAAIYRMERFLVNRWVTNHIFSRFFSADAKKCTRCGLCIKVCPISNIKEDKEKYPVWGRNCMACFTCELKCPKDAVSSPIDWPIFRPLLLYNVLRASRDPLLDHVRVIHTNGRTKVM
jgi:flavodoxin/Pyruvate/2-oxoacid:ferredoxin oxidoreductase delta subunit